MQAGPPAPGRKQISQQRDDKITIRWLVCAVIVGGIALVLFIILLVRMMLTGRAG